MPEPPNLSHSHQPYSSILLHLFFILAFTVIALTFAWGAYQHSDKDDLFPKPPPTCEALYKLHDQDTPPSTDYGNRKILAQVAIDVSKSIDETAAKRAFSETLESLKEGDCLELTTLAGTIKRLDLHDLTESEILILGDPLKEKQINDLWHRVLGSQNKEERKNTDLKGLLQQLRQDSLNYAACDIQNSHNIITIILSDFLHDNEDLTETAKEFQGLADDIFLKNIESPESFEPVQIFGFTLGIDIAGEEHTNKESLEKKEELLQALKETNGASIRKYDRELGIPKIINRLRSNFYISIRGAHGSMDMLETGEKGTIEVIVESNYPRFKLPIALSSDRQQTANPPTHTINRGINTIKYELDNIKPTKEYSAIVFLQPAKWANTVSKPEHANAIDKSIRLEIPLFRSETDSFVRYQLLDPKRIKFIHPGGKFTIEAKFLNRSASTVEVSLADTLEDYPILMSPFHIPPTGKFWCQQDLRFLIDGGTPDFKAGSVPQLKSFTMELNYKYLDSKLQTNINPYAVPLKIGESILSPSGTQVPISYIIPDFRRWRIYQYMTFFHLDENYNIAGYLSILIVGCFLACSRLSGKHILNPLKLITSVFILSITAMTSFCIYSSYDFLAQGEYSLASYINRILLGISLALSGIEILKLLLVLQRFYKSDGIDILFQKSDLKQSQINEGLRLLRPGLLMYLIPLIMFMIELMALPEFRE